MRDLTQFIFPFLTFVIGIMVGFFGRGIFDKQQIGENRANTFVLVIVTIIWATSVIIDIASPSYETSPLIHGLMGAIVGFFFKPWQSNNNIKTTRSANNYNQSSDVEQKEDDVINTKQLLDDTVEATRRDKYDETISDAEEDLAEAKRRKAYDEAKEKRRRK